MEATGSQLPGSGLTPLAGGWSGETFASEAGGERVVIRVYARPDRPESAPEVDAAVLTLMRGLLPVPEVLEVRRGDRDEGRPGLLVTSWLPGERADLILPTLDPPGVARLGAGLGRVAGLLAGMPTLRPGPFVDPDLAIGTFPDDGLGEWVESRLTGWSEVDRGGLRQVVEAAQEVLDRVDRSCLVHGDLNPKNVLVDPTTQAVTGVLDWEYAHSGHPMTDLGNVIRFERAEAYAAAALGAWAELRGGTPAEACEAARAADLWALVDLAARAGENPVTDRAERLLRTIATTGERDAWPHGW